MEEGSKVIREAKKAVYKWDSRERSSWYVKRTIDDVPIISNPNYQWAFTCRNELCSSEFYQDAVLKYNDFLASIVQTFAGSGEPVFWFRGQSNIEWPVQPSALRPEVVQSVYHALPGSYYGGKYTWKQLYFEKLTMSRFVRYGSSLLSKGVDGAEWYALAQHHGMPTRLLDWSLNPMVALWMAVCDVSQANKDGVIIAMAPYPLKEKNERCTAWSQNRINQLINWLTMPITRTNTGFDLHERVVKEMHEFCEDEAILTYTPFNYSARQSSQQSVFTFHTPPSPESELVANFGINEFYECHELVIPAEYKEFYKTFLYVNGIRRWSLFPDLENVARGVRESMVVVPGNNAVFPPFEPNKPSIRCEYNQEI